MSILVATLVTGGLLASAGWYTFGGPEAGAGGAVGGQNSADLPSPAERQLLALVPAGFAATCAPGRAPVTGALRGADAAVTCQPRAAGSPSSVTYLHFRRPQPMRHAYQALTRGLPPGNCMTTAGRGGYWVGSPRRAGGELACSASRRGLRVFVWTDRRLGILSYAVSSGATFAGLYQWWRGDSGPGPTPPGGKVTPPPPSSGIAGTLSAYFSGINTRNYRQSWFQLSAANQATGAYPQFAAGESTTTIAAWKLHGITRGASPGTYTAFVTFESHQDPAYAPNQSGSCDIWALDYTMIQRSGRWLIGQAGPHPGLPEYQTC